jgi:anti-sigma regulatory factor (Ser/Thr protein kinase)
VIHAKHSSWTVGIEATGDWYVMDVSGGTADADNVIFHPERWMIAGSGEPTGRGLGIVRGLMDDVKVDVWRGNVRVVCRLRRSNAASDHPV